MYLIFNAAAGLFFLLLGFFFFVQLIALVQINCCALSDCHRAVELKPNISKPFFNIQPLKTFEKQLIPQTRREFEV